MVDDIEARLREVELEIGSRRAEHQIDPTLDRVAELRSRADRPVELMVMGVPAEAKVLEEYAAAGFRRAVHWLPSAPRGPVERAMDRFEAAVAEFRGE